MRERLNVRGLIHMITPPILYLLLQEICGLAMTVAAVWKGFHGTTGVFSMEGVSFASTSVAAGIAIVVFAVMLERDGMRNPSDYRYEKTITWRLSYAVLLGFFAAAGVNRLLTMLEIDRFFPGFQETADVLYSAGLAWELLVLGLIVPVAEELLFRGVVYGRMKCCMSVRAAALWCSVFFGIWHGNVSQGIYAFLLGLLMVYVKERYQTMLAPILLHGFANIFAVLTMEVEWFGQLVSIEELYPAYLVIEAAFCILLFWRMEEDVQPRKIKKNRQWHREEQEDVDRN